MCLSRAAAPLFVQVAAQESAATAELPHSQAMQAAQLGHAGQTGLGSISTERITLHLLSLLQQTLRQSYLPSQSQWFSSRSHTGPAGVTTTAPAEATPGLSDAASNKRPVSPGCRAPSTSDHIGHWVARREERD